MTTPSEEAIRAQVEDCRNYGNALASTTGDKPWEQVARDAAAHILQLADIADALARRIDAEQAAVPVAWLYNRLFDTLPPSVQTIRHSQRDFALMSQSGWTETPLYAHPPTEALLAAIEKART
jgi:hypothetical protein